MKSVIVCFLLILPIMLVAQKKIYLYPEFELEVDEDVFTASINKPPTSPFQNFIPNTAYVKMREKDAAQIKIVTGYLWKMSYYYRNRLSHYDSKGNQLIVNNYFAKRTVQTVHHENEYLLDQEVFMINGMEFTLSKYYTENCGIEGKTSSYFYHLFMFHEFENLSYVYIDKNTGYLTESQIHSMRSQLIEVIQVFRGFRKTDRKIIGDLITYQTADDILHNFDSVSAIETIRLRKSLSDDLNYFNLISAGDNYADNLLSSDFLLNMMRTKNESGLIDTLISLRQIAAREELNTYLTKYREFDYSFEKRHHYASLLQHYKIPYSDYINTAESGIMPNPLDSIYFHSLICETDVALVLDNFSIQTNWNSDNAFSYLNETRTYHDYLNELVEKIYHDELHSTNPYFTPFVELINDSARKTFLLFNPEQFRNSELFLATFTRNNLNWSLQIDTLDKGLSYKGNERLQEYNGQYILHQGDSIFLLDINQSPVRRTILPTYTDSLKSHTFFARDVTFNLEDRYVFPIECEFQRDMVDDKTMDLLCEKLHNAELYYVAGSKNQDSNIDLEPCHSIVNADLYYQYARTLLTADQICYRVSYTIRDLNEDGIDELYSYIVSNGKIEDLICFTTNNGEITQLSREEATQRLYNDSDFLNLLHFSKIGKKKL